MDQKQNLKRMESKNKTMKGIQIEVTMVGGFKVVGDPVLVSDALNNIENVGLSEDQIIKDIKALASIFLEPHTASKLVMPYGDGLVGLNPNNILCVAVKEL